MTDHNNNHGAHEAGVDFDRRDAKSGLIAIASGSVLVLLVGMIIGIYWLYTVAYEKVEFDQYTGVASKELLAIREREEEHLHKYSYVDKEHGVVRIPIEQAMEMVAAEYAEGKLGYNMKSYAVKEEPLGGAAGASSATAPASSATAPNGAAASAAKAEEKEAAAKH